MPGPVPLPTSATRIGEKLFISAQPSLDDFPLFAAAGFRRVISNRPAAEQEGQPTPVSERKAAEAAGLSYRFIPVTGSTITEADVRAFQEAVSASDGPVIAHCKSGIRSASLHVIGEVLDGRLAQEDVTVRGHEWGLDLSGAARWLAQHAVQTPQVKGFFDPRTFSVQYVVSDPATRHCAIIDAVLDYDEKSGATATTNADLILAYVAEQGLTVAWILDTHPHADHFSAAQYLHGKTGAPTAIGAHVPDVQRLWQSIYNWPELQTDGSQWHHLFEDGEAFKLGSIDGRVLFSPGHTLASITFVIGDAAFVHDTLFMPDSGTARADFPGGSAEALWASIQAILALPDETRIFTGHDYQPEGRAPRWESNVAEQKLRNTHIAGLSKAEFIVRREARDKTLPMPKLILHALQVNIAGGRLPKPEDNGRRYLKIPIDALGDTIW
ncbi:TIGR01244 family phosphatase [Acidisoma cellulosilytica]|uniref:TIGR01244 family phosphatase n=1 Tax=Acidisoma cellulosilyticum TaxID=2802395 RepID=A0A964E1U0_9PROT|nr:bifunctional sulfur transferase/dioxygenase Blh [Acidisoma cellulosilyticum]MCB8878880.1 TIGR01244 family phosphatase [Acidisoma cellulosilyticum]